jgi:NarL family two-component system response regulator LiaR
MLMTNPPPSVIRVVLVDDHAVVRRGLATFLEVYDDLELVGEAGNGQEAVAVVADTLPDIVLMDLVMPVMDGPTAIAAIRARHPQVQIIALTSFSEEKLVQGALQAGAISYMLKNISADVLVEAIRAAYRGRSMLASEARDALIHALNHPNAIGHDLTERERDVLVLLVQGMSNPAIAEKLIISRATVKFHVSNILSKLEVATRTEAVALAVQQGLV